jgi:hypothetical protein
MQLHSKSKIENCYGLNAHSNAQSPDTQRVIYTRMQQRANHFTTIDFTQHWFWYQKGIKNMHFPRARDLVLL